jgi:membrane protease YdiL (CAAX protease family)
MTSLLFAALHLQYSWFGIGVIFLLSLVLGIIRIRTNTTLAMAVHVGYDIVALASV